MDEIGSVKLLYLAACISSMIIRIRRDGAFAYGPHDYLASKHTTTLTTSKLESILSQPMVKSVT